MLGDRVRGELERGAGADRRGADPLLGLPLPHLGREEILARLAGDEFVVVAERADDRAATAIAQRLTGAMLDPVATHGHTFSVGLSLGIATFPRDGDSIDDLLGKLAAHEPAPTVIDIVRGTA